MRDKLAGLGYGLHERRQPREDLFDVKVNRLQLRHAEQAEQTLLIDIHALQPSRSSRAGQTLKAGTDREPPRWVGLIHTSRTEQLWQE